MPFRLETTVVKEGSIADMYKMEGIDLEQEISDLDPISDKTVTSVDFSQSGDNFAQQNLKMWYTKLEDVGREGGVPTLYKTKAEAEARDKFLRSKIFPRRIISFYYGIDWNYTVRYAPKEKLKEWSSLSEAEKQQAFQTFKGTYPKLASETQELHLKMFEAVVPTHSNLEYYSPTAKEVREIYNKCDYIRLDRPKNNIGWYMITKKEFQASVGQLNAYWGLKVPTEMGDYEYNKRTGMWLATNRVKELEKQGQIPLACTVTWKATGQEVPAQTLTKWQKFLAWLKKGWDKFVNIIKNISKDIHNHLTSIWNGLIDNGFGGMLSAMVNATKDHIDSIKDLFNKEQQVSDEQYEKELTNKLNQYEDSTYSNGQIIEGIVSSFNSQLKSSIGADFEKYKKEFKDTFKNSFEKLEKVEDLFVSILPTTDLEALISKTKKETTTNPIYLPNLA